jgi:hypothetical protein
MLPRGPSPDTSTTLLFIPKLELGKRTFPKMMRERKRGREEGRRRRKRGREEKEEEKK